MTRVLAIDPGKSGGIAWIGTDNVMAYKMPNTERDIWDLIRQFASNSDRAVIEKVATSPQMGVKSAGTFMGSYYGLRMALTAAGLPFEAVAPGVWQRPFSLPTEKAAGSITAKKNAHKARAQELFPELRITHANADALLIAEYMRRLLTREKAA